MAGAGGSLRPTSADRPLDPPPPVSSRQGAFFWRLRGAAPCGQPSGPWAQADGQPGDGTAAPEADHEPAPTLTTLRAITDGARPGPPAARSSQYLLAQTGPATCPCLDLLPFAAEPEGAREGVLPARLSPRLQVVRPGAGGTVPEAGRAVGRSVGRYPGRGLQQCPGSTVRGLLAPRTRSVAPYRRSVYLYPALVAAVRFRAVSRCG